MKSISIGKKKWAIAEGYIPSWSNGPEHEMTSHEALCFLNAGTETAFIQLYLYFADRNPVGPYEFELLGQRCLHQRLNDLTHPEEVPKAVDYSCVIESSVPIVVQHTRLDSRQADNALMTTIAYSENEF